MPGFSICPIILDICQGFEYASGIKYVRVPNKLGYSYNNIIIIVTNIIMLEFLSAQFVSLGAPQITILSFFNPKTAGEVNLTHLWFFKKCIF